MELVLNKFGEKYIEQGMKRGMKEGRMEEKTQIASRMLHAGFPVSTISNMTDLSEAEIAAIGK